MAAASFRCIAFAYKHVDSEHSKIDDEGLTLLGFVGLKDPCRPKVRTAIEACTKARAIAMECGIMSTTSTQRSTTKGLPEP